ncbi:BRCA1-associated RING domain protein 1 [Zea mays]|uniref:BRCA1-associated RING domain protein 1 n=1 Tax=Zea mays TaxID=4577 RepID=A0A1D6HC21_MAIZE|nr:BRCA1-associated RING domain protein 1 [Zea mays]
MSRKRAFSEEIGGATALKSLPTPIGLFEDECVFCHSFRTSQGRVVSIDECDSSDAIYVHRKCLEWASGIWFKGDIVMDFKPEITRASKLRCARCGLKGAALGCYYGPCLTSFHVPCAVQTIGCRWDGDGYMLCPQHVSNALPCDKQGTDTKENYNASSLHQSQHTDKKGSFDDHNRENEQADQLNISNASLLPQTRSPYIEREQVFDSRRRRKNGQTDHLDISTPCVPHNQHSHPKEEISTDSSRDHHQQIDQLQTSRSSLPLGACQGEEMESDQPDASSCPADELVLLGLCLSVDEKDFVQKFACWTKATLAEEWAENVTHVIVGKGAGSSWCRSFEVLMAILLGKWVVRFEWVADCLQLTPGPEASYEVLLLAASSIDSLGANDGPKQSRIRATEGEPKLFSGLCFCLSDLMSPGNRGRTRGLIAAGGGRVLDKRDLRLLPKKDPDPDGRRSPSPVNPRPYFVYDVEAPGGGRFSARLLRREIDEAREQAAAGAQVIGHLSVFDAVAAYDAGILLV